MSQQVLKRGVNDSVNHGRSAKKLMAVEAFACRPSRPVNYFRAPSTGKLSTEFARGQVASQLANCFPIPWRNVCRRWEPRDNDLVGEGEGVRKLRGTDHRRSSRIGSFIPPIRVLRRVTTQCGLRIKTQGRERGSTLRNCEETKYTIFSNGISICRKEICETFDNRANLLIEIISLPQV